MPVPVPLEANGRTVKRVEGFKLVTPYKATLVAPPHSLNESGSESAAEGHAEGESPHPPPPLSLEGLCGAMEGACLLIRDHFESVNTQPFYLRAAL